LFLKESLAIVTKRIDSIKREKHGLDASGGRLSSAPNLGLSGSTLSWANDILNKFEVKVDEMNVHLIGQTLHSI
jgi:hypothetical protein